MKIYAAQRDNSFYISRGKGGKYHIITDNKEPACGVSWNLLFLHDDIKILANKVPVFLRCKKNGCKKYYSQFTE